MSNFKLVYEKIKIYREPDNKRAEGARSWQECSGHMSGTKN